MMGERLRFLKLKQFCNFLSPLDMNSPSRIAKKIAQTVGRSKEEKLELWETILKNFHMGKEVTLEKLNEIGENMHNRRKKEVEKEIIEKAQYAIWDGGSPAEVAEASHKCTVETLENNGDIEEYRSCVIGALDRIIQGKKENYQDY